MLGVYDGRGKRRRELASASAYKCHFIHHVTSLAQLDACGKANFAAHRLAAVPPCPASFGLRSAETCKSQMPRKCTHAHFML